MYDGYLCVYVVCLALRIPRASVCCMLRVCLERCVLYVACVPGAMCVVREMCAA